MRPAAVAIGTSWGGLGALTAILAALPASFPMSVVIVQHRSKDSDKLLAELLQDVCALKVHDAEDKDVLEPSTVYIAPSDYHLLVDGGRLSLSTDEPVRYSRPSIDVLFSSLAEEYGSSAIGVVLTGANQDGARGLSRILSLGGQGIIQDPETAEIPIMPAAAKRAAPGAEILQLEQIAPRLIQMGSGSVPSRRKAG